jgi:hypothetical protein
MTHVEIAATQGMKAGYKARKRVLKRGGLSTTRAALRESFGDYCAKFGPDVTAAQASMRNKPRSAKVVGVRVFEDDVTERVLADRLAEARQRLAELEAEAATVEAPKRERKPASKSKSATKENLWREWAVRKHGIPTQVGAEFAYQGKRRKSIFRVTRVTSEGVYSVRVS